MATSTPRSVPELNALLFALGFPEENLPHARDGSIWNELRGDPYSLTLPELSALQNHRCSTPPYAESCNHLYVVKASAHEEKLSSEKASQLCLQNVGGVISESICIGTCAAVIYNGQMLIITCRHVVFYEDIGAIPIYLFACHFCGLVYEGVDLAYVGSSKSFDVSIFRVHGRSRHGFQLSVTDVFQFQKIYLACFPEATEVEHVATNEPKMYQGIVAACESLYDVALADISPMPNSSGGAIFSPLSPHVLHGIHMGVFYHENSENKLITAKISEEATSQAESFTLTTDDVLYQPPRINAPEVNDGNTDQSASPESNTRKRSLYAYDNVEFKGAVAYFVTSSVLLRLLNEGIGLKRMAGYGRSR